MSYKEEIFNFLSQPENLELAFEISKHLDEIKPQLEKNFWTRVQAILESKLGEDESWIAEMDDVTDIKKNYYGVSVYPDRIEPGTRYLYVRLEKEAQRPLLGIQIWKDNGEKFDGDLSHIETLIAGLRSKLKIKGYKSEKAWWVGWKYVDSRALGDFEVCREIAENTYAAEKGEEIWTIFQDIRNDLESINSKLKTV